MIQIIEMVASRRLIIGTAATFPEAKVKAEAMGVAYMEDDPEYVDCADGLLNDGRLIAIQPEGFTLSRAEKKATDSYESAKAFVAECRTGLDSFDKEFGL